MQQCHAFFTPYLVSTSCTAPTAAVALTAAVIAVGANTIAVVAITITFRAVIIAVAAATIAVVAATIAVVAATIAIGANIIAAKVIMVTNAAIVIGIEAFIMVVAIITIIDVVPVVVEAAALVAALASIEHETGFLAKTTFRTSNGAQMGSQLRRILAPFTATGKKPDKGTSENWVSKFSCKIFIRNRNFVMKMWLKDGNILLEKEWDVQAEKKHWEVHKS